MRVVATLAALVIVLAASAVAAVAARSASGGSGGVDGDGTAVRTSAIAVGVTASPAPCNDRAYNFIGPGSHWATTLNWRYRSSSTPAGLITADVLAVIKKSFRNIATSRNDCGLADQVSATHHYLGSTTRQPNVAQAGSCGSPDGVSVVAFAPLDNYYAGYTCIWWNGANEIYEMDMRLDPDQHWWLPGTICNNGLSMEALVTHEAGHAYGLGHVSEANHGRLTMSVFIDGLCQNQEATLGRGDVRGLRAVY